MSDDSERPRFLPSFIKAIGESAEQRGWRALVPVWLIASLVFGAVASHFVPASFWSAERHDVSLVVYTGVLTLNGLILTLSWNAFARICESICAPGFASYLKSKNLMNRYLVYISYVHVAQLFAIVASAVGLIFVLASDNVTYNKIAFAVVIAASAYAIKTASSAVTIMSDLIWQKPIFDDFVARQEGRNVFRFRARDEDGGQL